MLEEIRVSFKIWVFVYNFHVLFVTIQLSKVFLLPSDRGEFCADMGRPEVSWRIASTAKPLLNLTWMKLL